MKVRLHQDLEKYRGNLVPTVETLTDLVRALKVGLPELVLMGVSSNYRCCCHLTANMLSTAQWAMTNLVVGKPGTRNITYGDHMPLHRIYSIRLYPPPGTGVKRYGIKLYKFMISIPNSIWIEWGLVRTIANDAQKDFVFYIPAEGYDGYSISDNAAFNIPCSTSIVTPKLVWK